MFKYAMIMGSNKYSGYFQTYNLFTLTLDGFVVLFGSWVLYCHLLVFMGCSFTTLLKFSFFVLILALLSFDILLCVCNKNIVANFLVFKNCKTLHKNKISFAVKIILAFFVALSYKWIDNYLIFWSISISFVVCIIYSRPPYEHIEIKFKEVTISKNTKIGILLLICFAIFITLCSHRPDADDAHYLGFTISALDFPERPLMSFDSMFGEENLPVFSEHYRVHTYELLVAVLSSLLHVDHRTLYYILLPPCFASLVVISHWLALQNLFSRKAFLGLFISIIVLFAYGDTHHSYGNFSFVRLFQNKGILVSVCIPTIVYYASRLSKNYDFGSLFLLFFSQIIALGICGTGILVAPLASSMVLLAYWRFNRRHNLILFSGLLSSTYLVAIGLLTKLGFSNTLVVIPVFTFLCFLVISFLLKNDLYHKCIIISFFCFALVFIFFLKEDSRNLQKIDEFYISQDKVSKQSLPSISNNDLSTHHEKSTTIKIADETNCSFQNGSLLTKNIYLDRGYYKVNIQLHRSHNKDSSLKMIQSQSLEILVLNKYDKSPSAVKAIQIDNVEEVVESIVFPALTREYAIELRIINNERLTKKNSHSPHIVLKQINVERASSAAVVSYWWDQLLKNPALKYVFGTKSRATIIWFTFLALPIIFTMLSPNKNITRLILLNLLITFNPVISTFLPISTGIPSWRLLWACPLPLFIGLAGSGVASTDFKILRWNLGQIITFCLIIVFLIVPGNLTTSKKNGTLINFPQYKINPIQYEIAQKIVCNTRQTDFVLAPESISSWITQFRKHPKLIGVRQYFAYIKFMKDNMSEEEFNSRILMFKLFNNPKLFNRDFLSILETIESWKIKTLVFEKAVWKGINFEEELKKTNYQLAYIGDGYEIWNRLE
jgi:hypothetical protein